MSKSLTEGEYQMTRILAKGNKTDPKYQEFLCRRPKGIVDDPSDWQYFHPQLSKWYTLPIEWREKTGWMT